MTYVTQIIRHGEVNKIGSVEYDCAIFTNEYSLNREILAKGLLRHKIGFLGRFSKFRCLMRRKMLMNRFSKIDFLDFVHFEFFADFF